MTAPQSTRCAAAGQAGGVSFLASVTSLEEARLAVAGGVDIVDAKDPSAGALGALPLATLGALRAALPGIALSATVGDPFADAQSAAAAVAATAATGVDFVKVGLLPGPVLRETISRVGALALPQCRLVAVLIADRGFDLEDVQRLATAGFRGVMLDTADKSVGALPDIVPLARLQAFVASAHEAGLFAGLAGALRLPHIAGLRALSPDVLGFRGALTVGERRTAALDPEAVARVRRALSAETQPAGQRVAPAASAARATAVPAAMAVRRGTRPAAGSSAGRLQATLERRLRERVT